MRAMRYTLCTLLLFCFLFALPGAADEKSGSGGPPAFPPLPALSDPTDIHMQQLGTIYQKDPRFGKLPYDTTRFSVRGCAPSSVANALIAAFGVTDEDTAAQIVEETLRILCPGQKYGRKPIDLNRLAHLLDPAFMAESAEKYPTLSSLVAAYPGVIDYSADTFTLERALAAAQRRSEGGIATGRISVRDSWEDAVHILHALHEAEQDDAALILAYAGAGTSSEYAPLRTSAAGHYLALYIPVGMFAESGTVYVLDSMPRAVFGEAYRLGLAYRSCYAFVEEEPDASFNARFAASRISPTVIRIDLNEAALAQIESAAAAAPEGERAQARIAAHTEQMTYFKIYGTCTAILRL